MHDRSNYGKELILDLHDCDSRTFTKESIEKYLIEICDLIDMQRKDLHFWADEDYPEEQRPKDPKTFGISAVQFILTSSIVIHTLPLYRGGSVYINLFSCKDFDHTAAREFTVEWFKAEEYIETEVARR